jgi:hypothetical protein
MTKKSAKLKIGDKMPDGTIYAGISPDTGEKMYAMPEDASLMMTFNKAKEYASGLEAHGHKDWRGPTKEELVVLFNNRAAVGGFKKADLSPSHKTGEGWYWAFSEERVIAGNAHDGVADWGRDWNPDKIKCSVRCVRYGD